jgi:hypothetical protein
MTFIKRSGENNHRECLLFTYPYCTRIQTKDEKSIFSRKITCVYDCFLEIRYPDPQSCYFSSMTMFFLYHGTKVIISFDKSHSKF